MSRTIYDFENSELGKIKIAPQVIEMIAKYSINEVEGVVGLSTSITEEITDLFTRGGSKGVKVDLNEQEARIDISIIIKSGFKIPKLAENAQENVKSTIENMTGITVNEVNIYISGIELENTNFY